MVGMDAGLNAVRAGHHFIVADDEARGRSRRPASGEWTHSMALVTGRGDDGSAVLGEEG
jgi:hypothetical protein